LKQSNKIGDYLNIVCEQIRWKKAHTAISKEIEDHINDQIDAFMTNGLDREEATDRAIKEMGDPVLIGSELDHTYKPKMEWSILILTCIALFVGLAIRVFFTYDSDISFMITKSIISTIIGIGCMFIAYILDFTIIGKYPKTLFFGLVAVTIVIITTISPVVNGKYFYVQFLLLLFPTFFAGIIYSMRNKGYLGIILSYIIMSIPAFIGSMSSNFSSTFLYFLSCIILLTIAGIKGWFNTKRIYALFVIYIPTIIISILVLLSDILGNSYRVKRLMSFIDPSLDPMGSGYIGTVTRNIIINSKFIGKGSTDFSTTWMLPMNTDYLITYLIHRLGWISFIFLMTILLVFIIRSYILCSRQKSILGKLVSTSVLITFTMQVVVYVASNLGFQILSQQTLPLISYGGTATITNMILIGIMLSVFKTSDLVSDSQMKALSNEHKFLEFTEGKIIINLKFR